LTYGEYSPVLKKEDITYVSLSQKREEVEGRHIPKNAFIEQLFQARENVNEIKSEFGEKITVMLLKRNINSNNSKHELNIKNIDNYIYIAYTKDKLHKDL
jgi:hypothetical protein